MKCKKILAVLLITILAMPLFSISASAGNTSDQSVTWHFSGGNNRVLATFRAKYDDTSVYQKCTKTSYTYYSYVKGSYTSTGTSYNVSNGSTYTFNTGSVRYMSNYAYEWGYSYAGLVAIPDNSKTYTASMLWSPDSV